MHSNIWTAIFLTSLPAGLILFVGLLQWAIRRKFPKLTILIAAIFALIPLSFVIGQLRSQKKEMSKRQGIYRVVQSDKIEELCSTSNADSLQLTLLRSGAYSFNVKPCFADRKEGKWKWQDDLVGTYAVFEIKISNYAYLHFDEKDTLRLIKEGRNYLTFAKQDIKE